jgi:hypothetical protein
VADNVKDAPFLNLFDRPVFFLGLPFDLSFIFPETALVSPPYNIVVTKKVYNSANTQLGADIVETIDVDLLEGYICSLNITQGSIPALVDHLTVEIEI